MQLDKLTEQDFKSWLDSKPDEEIVGVKGYCRRCPMARFLNEVCGCGDAYVNQSYWKTYTDGAFLDELPIWAERIVDYVDTTFSYEITAKQLKEYYAQNS